jgi:hypothetical protein
MVLLFQIAMRSTPLGRKYQFPQCSVRPNDLIATVNVMVFPELIDMSRRIAKVCGK